MQESTQFAKSVWCRTVQLGSLILQIYIIFIQRPHLLPGRHSPALPRTQPLIVVSAAGHDAIQACHRGNVETMLSESGLFCFCVLNLLFKKMKYGHFEWRAYLKKKQTNKKQNGIAVMDGKFNYFKLDLCIADTWIVDCWFFFCIFQSLFWLTWERKTSFLYFCTSQNYCCYATGLQQACRKLLQVTTWKK